ncbi:MAG: hypothetical protein Q7T16_01405 [Candidatus Burarchaeum sp.]|nr:hypothetical protein [Candidatus Burarchaeum sp.]MDO8339293.1 hypothetical protein [Candidatus Burarchaeum sp.]
MEFTNQAQLFRFLYDKQFKRSMKSQLKAKFSDLPAFKQVSDLDIIGFLNNHTRPNVLFYQLVYFIINVLAYSGFVGFCFIFMLKFSDNCALYGCSQLLALFFFSAPILLLIVSLSYDYGAITLLLSPDFCIYEVITTRRKYIGYLRTETKTEIILRSFYVDATKGLPDNLTAHPTELVIPKTQIIHIEKHFLNPK